MLVRIASALAALVLSIPTPAASAFPREAAEAAVLADTAAAAPANALALNALRAGLRPGVLELALAAHARVEGSGQAIRPILTVIDFSLRSRDRRLWVLDLERGEVLAHELVAHGRNSGDDQASQFSNRHGSYQSSLGTFVTGSTYHGKHGLSLRLRGMDGTLNDQAEARAIVVHGAEYVNEGIIEQLGRLGRSQGCPALSPEAAPRVIELIRDGTVLFAHFGTVPAGTSPAAS